MTRREQRTRHRDTCVSEEPRRSGLTEGGENLIITAEELRRLLQAQCKEEDQVVWMTTSQTGSQLVVETYVTGCALL
jgi:hypothetical protein